jgi:large conductance mechanosensitive channel
MVQEFKAFINRGNLIDIAVAFVMGLAFAAVITSLTDDVINPIIAKIFDVQDLNEWVVWGVRIGSFLVAIIDFLIVAFVMFFVVKAYNRMKRADEADDEPSEDTLLLREIRDGINAARHPHTLA